MIIKENYSLIRDNTFRIDVKTRYFIKLESDAEIIEFVNSSIFSLQNKLLIGSGANILFTQDFDGVVFKLSSSNISIEEENEDEIILKADAGLDWDEFVRFCVNNCYYGLENLALIPGTIGAAPVQNIGAYGAEQKDRFFSLNYYDIESKTFKSLSYNECNFGYRDSIFKRELKDKAIITNVCYKLSKQPYLNLSYSGIKIELEKRGIIAPTISELYNTIVNIRNSKLPDIAKVGNAGSFFKNPVIKQSLFEDLRKKYEDMPHYPALNGVKIPAAYLIEKCGWKGYTKGEFGVWKSQPLVLANYGNASGKEILQLANDIIESVKKTFGVILEPEAIII